MIDRNRQRFRQLPEYDEQMTRLKEEYPQVCKIANRYSLLIFLTDLILFVASFIALNFLFMVAPDSKEIRNHSNVRLGAFHSRWKHG